MNFEEESKVFPPLKSDALKSNKNLDFDFVKVLEKIQN